MSPDRRSNAKGSERIYCYYRCPKRRIEGPGACPNEKTQRAEKVEAGVWEVISSLLAEPERLRLGLERIQSLNAEERHRVYELLDLRAVARCDGTVELTAPLGRIGLCVNQTQLHS
jgi:hypothetical protein